LSNSAILIKDEYVQKSQELPISPDLQIAGGSNSSLFEVCVFCSLLSIVVSNKLFCTTQENVGGTTYYYTPDENVKPTVEEPIIGKHSQITEKMSHTSLLNRRIQSPNQLVSTSQNQMYSVYSGPSSFLQSCSGQQRSSFFMNEDIRADLLQRNSVALSISDPALFPGIANLFHVLSLYLLFKKHFI
jgi:hypothetical protein